MSDVLTALERLRSAIDEAILAVAFDQLCDCRKCTAMRELQQAALAEIKAVPLASNPVGPDGFTLDGLISQVEQGIVVFRRIPDQSACLNALKELRDRRVSTIQMQQSLDECRDEIYRLRGVPETNAEPGTWIDNLGRTHTCDQFDCQTSCSTCESEPSAAPETSEDSREWVFLHRPGMVPQRKGPFHNSDDTAGMLEALYQQHPDCTCDVVTIHGRDPWPDDGREYLDIRASLGSSVKSS